MWPKIKNLINHSGIYLLGNVFNRVGAFLLLPLYTHYLSLETYGVLELLYSTVAVVSTLWSAGLAHTTVRFYFDAREGKARDRIVITNLMLSLVLSSIGALILFGFRDIVAVWVLGDGKYADAIAICALIIVLELMSEVGFAYLRARTLSILFVALSAARLLIQVTVSIYAVAHLEWGLFGVLSANLVAVSVVWLITICYVLYQCGISIDRPRIGEMFKYSLPFAMSSVIGVVMANADRFILKEFISLEAVGVYALALKFAQLLNLMLAEPFFRSYGPFRFSIIEREDAKDIQVAVAEYLAMAAMIVALGIALFTPDVLVLMASESFMAAHQYVPVLVLAIGIGALSYCFETGILYRKKTKFTFYISLIDLAIKVALNLLLIPILGIWGAVIAQLLAMIAHATITNRISERMYPVAYRYWSMFSVLIIGASGYGVSLFLDYSVLWVSVSIKLLLVFLVTIMLLFTNRDARLLVAQKMGARK